jgi:putative acetyltransferase
MASPIEVPTEADFDRITEVWEAAVRATHHFLAADDVDYFRPLVRNTYLGMVELTCLRDDGGSIIGFAGVAEGKLEMLFVHPDWHGHGVGKRLLEHARDVQGAMLVDVNEQNPRAVEFYKRMGFRVYDRSPLDSLGKPYPLLHMRYEIPVAAT